VLRIRIWSVADRKIVRDWPATEPPLTFLQFGPDGKTLVGGSQSGKEKFRLDPPAPLASDFLVAMSPDGKLLATADQCGNLVHFWDLATGEQAGEFSNAPCGVTCLAFAPDSCLLAVGASDTTVVLVDVRKIVRKP
jgi:WD40 repeat protein